MRRIPKVEHYELEGEKIRRSSDYYDHATIMRQVGALPEVGAPPS